MADWMGQTQLQRSCLAGISFTFIAYGLGWNDSKIAPLGKLNTLMINTLLTF